MWENLQWVAGVLAFVSIALHGLSITLKTEEKSDDENTSSRDPKQP